MAIGYSLLLVGTVIGICQSHAARPLQKGFVAQFSQGIDPFDDQH